MARNEEKSHGMMNKWTAMRAGSIGGKRGTVAQRTQQLSHLRPKECQDLSEAELARKILMRGITGKIDEIQNAGLGEHMIRELNDEINDKLRRKRTWEKRIIELGGPNYMRLAPKVFDGDGRELPGDGGYKYFGAARSLPVVQKLFAKKKKGAARRSKNQILSGISSDYFSLDGGSEDNGAILRAESAAEASLRARHDASVRQKHGSSSNGGAFNAVENAVRDSKNVTLADICKEEQRNQKASSSGSGGGGEDLEAMRKQLLARLG
jgi:pre-mRNA-splicing factor ISY1